MTRISPRLAGLTLLALVAGSSALFAARGLLTRSVDDDDDTIHTSIRAVAGPLPAHGHAASTTDAHELNRLSLRTAGAWTWISADARIYEGQPGTTYLWALVVLDPKTGRVVYEHRFEHLAFEAPAGAWVPLALDEVLPIPLPAGTYSAQLVAYRLPAGVGPDVLNAPDALDQHTGPRGGAELRLE